MSGGGASRSLERLRLRAEDAADLQVISGCLQDALTDVGSMNFQPKGRRFVLLASRYMWERQDPAATGGFRVRSGLRFRHVEQVRAQGIDLRDRHGLLVLLAMEARDGPDGRDIALCFAGGGTVRLKAECLDCELADLTEPWATPRRPSHDDARDHVQTKGASR